MLFFATQGCSPAKTSRIWYWIEWQSGFLGGIPKQIFGGHLEAIIESIEEWPFEGFPKAIVGEVFKEIPEYFFRKIEWTSTEIFDRILLWISKEIFVEISYENFNVFPEWIFAVFFTQRGSQRGLFCNPGRIFWKHYGAIPEEILWEIYEAILG